MSEVTGGLVFLGNVNADIRRIHSPIPTILLENGTREFGSGRTSPVMIVPSQELKLVTDAEKGTRKKNGDGRPPAHSNDVSNQVNRTLNVFC
jgi:hypothetical protein